MRAVITFEGSGARVVRDALSPEAGRDVPRTQVSVGGEGDRVEIVVEAEETSALRAALNSYLRWAQVALDVHGSVRA